MKNIIKTALVGLTLIPLVSLASIDYNLQYGSRGQEVTELQEFLVANNYLDTSPTGNFYSLTLKAVKAYQIDNKIPPTGYVGVLTRAAINASLLTDLASSTDQAIEETGTSTLPSSNTALQATMDQAALQAKQLQAQLDSQAKLDTINQSIQSLTTQLQGQQVVSSPVQAPLPDLYYDTTTSENVLTIGVNVQIDPTSVRATLGTTTYSYVSYSIWTNPNGANNCWGAIGCTNDGTLKVYKITVDGNFPDTYFKPDLHVTFNTVDGRNFSQGK